MSSSVDRIAGLPALAALQEAVIDGRTENVRYRQNQIQALHALLRTSGDAISQAIVKDKNVQNTSALVQAETEAEVEIYLAMEAIKHFYGQLDFKGALKTEYLVANGLNHTERRVRKGLVVIRPTTHTRYYSIISTLAAAIAAGNCVCIELLGNPSSVDKILGSILPSALDPETFAISSNRVDHSNSCGSFYLVDQISDTTVTSSENLLSNPSARSVAVVSRTADLEHAADIIVKARLNFQGMSSYSPDLVIVNDFCKTEFINACLRSARKGRVAHDQNMTGSAESETGKAFRDGKNNGDLILHETEELKIADITNPNSAVTMLKIRGFFLAIVACTSMTDTIRLAHKILPDQHESFLASYIFGDLASSKFLAQHLNSNISFVNSIPLHLLVGPAAPLGHTPDVKFKYNHAMFSTSQPHYVTLPGDNLAKANAALGGFDSLSDQSEFAKNLKKAANEALPPTGQPQGHAIGFFEQGILLGAGIILTVVVPSIGIGVWYLGKTGWQMGKGWRH